MGFKGSSPLDSLDQRDEMRIVGGTRLFLSPWLTPGSGTPPGW